MSADNFATCPRCERRKAAALSQKAAELAKTYGKLSLEQWEKLRDELEAAKQKTLRQTFREDYEFHGAETGIVTASYAGSCSECGLSTSFEHKHTIEGIADV